MRRCKKLKHYTINISYNYTYTSFIMICDNMICDEEFCNTIIQNFNNNDMAILGINMFHSLLDVYFDTYNNKQNLTNDYLHTYFRNDTKLLFNVINNTFADKEQMLGAFDDDEEDTIKEKEQYLTFCDNVQYVTEHIDTVHLTEPDEEFSSNCANAISYLNQKNNERNDLSNTFDSLKPTLSNLTNTLYNLTNTYITNNETNDDNTDDDKTDIETDDEPFIGDFAAE